MSKLFRPVLTRPSMHNFPELPFIELPAYLQAWMMEITLTPVCAALKAQLASIKKYWILERNIEFLTKALFRLIQFTVFSWSPLLVPPTREHLGCSSNHSPPLTRLIFPLFTPFCLMWNDLRRHFTETKENLLAEFPVATLDRDLCWGLCQIRNQ